MKEARRRQQRELESKVTDSRHKHSFKITVDNVRRKKKGNTNNEKGSIRYCLVYDKDKQNTFGHKLFGPDHARQALHRILNLKPLNAIVNAFVEAIFPTEWAKHAPKEIVDRVLPCVRFASCPPPKNGEANASAASSSSPPQIFELEQLLKGFNEFASFKYSAPPVNPHAAPGSSGNIPSSDIPAAPFSFMCMDLFPTPTQIQKGDGDDGTNGGDRGGEVGAVAASSSSKQKNKKNVWYPHLQNAAKNKKGKNHQQVG